MIYGNKFLKSSESLESLIKETANTGILINELNCSLEDSSFINESKEDYKNLNWFEKIIFAIYDRINDFIAKIIDIISNIFKKILPKFYQFLQKQITNIKNDNYENAGKGINYQGFKDIKYYILNQDYFKFLNEVNEKDYLTKIADFYDEYTSKMNIVKKSTPTSVIKQHLASLKNNAISITESIADNVEEFNNHDEDYYTNEIKVKLESYNDYKKELTYLNDRVEKDTKLKNSVLSLYSTMTRVSKRYTRRFSKDFDVIGNQLKEIGKEEVMDSLVLPQDVNGVFKIYSGLLAILQHSLQTEVNTAKDLSKFYFHITMYSDTARKTKI